MNTGTSKCDVIFILGSVKIGDVTSNVKRDHFNAASFCCQSSASFLCECTQNFETVHKKL